MTEPTSGEMPMRGWSNYFWWGAAGAILGGVWSAVLMLYAGVAPDRHLSGPTAFHGSAHTPATLLAGLLLGAASGASLGRCLHVHPGMKRSLLGLALVFLLVIGVLSDSGLTDLLRLPNEGVRAEIAEGRLKREWLGRVSQPGADLTGAWLPEADLRRAKLSARRLVGACLTGVDLRGADLRRADLSEQEDKERGVVSPTDLERADLRGADLRGADLCGADLIGAILAGTRLTGARCSAHTSWPDGFDPQQHGALAER
jgi:pentapeptide repeat protein